MTNKSAKTTKVAEAKVTKKAVKAAPAAATVKKTVKKETAAVKTTTEKSVAATVKKTVKKVAAPAKTSTKAPVKAPAKTTVKKVAAKKVAPKDDKPHKKLKLSKSMQKHYIALLMDLRKDFSEQFKYHQQEALTSKKDSAGERAGMATHMADLGSDNFRHDIELGLLSDEGDVLVMIDEALQRIADSEYGVCVECGCEINPERLDAKPYARFCTRCKERQEELEDPSRRHR